MRRLKRLLLVLYLLHPCSRVLLTTDGVGDKPCRNKV